MCWVMEDGNFSWMDKETSVSSTEVEQEVVIIDNSHIETASEVKTSIKIQQ